MPDEVIMPPVHPGEILLTEFRALLDQPAVALRPRDRERSPRACARQHSAPHGRELGLGDESG
jgi:hypothetical protein